MISTDQDAEESISVFFVKKGAVGPTQKIGAATK